MKFNEWEAEIKKLHKKAEKMLVDEEILSESVVINQETWSVYLGDYISWKHNDKPAPDYDVRFAYSAREKGWQELLGGLQTKVTMAEGLNTLLIEAVAEKYMKEAVLDRLTGDNDISDNETIIRKAYNRRIDKLNKILPRMNNRFMTSFELPSPSKNYGLTLSYNTEGAVIWGMGKEKGAIKCLWSFLQHFEQIEATVTQFAEYFKPIAKMCRLTDGK